MSQLVIKMEQKPFPYNLGQTELPSPDPPDVAASVAERYQELLAWCNENLGPDMCRRILPSQPIWLPEQRVNFGLPWYVWLGIGFLVAKILR